MIIIIKLSLILRRRPVVVRYKYQGVRVGRQSHARLGYRQLFGGFHFVPLEHAGQQDEPEPGDQLLSDARSFAGAERQKVFRFFNTRFRAGLALDESFGIECPGIVPVFRTGVELVIVDDYARAFGDFETYVQQENSQFLVLYGVKITIYIVYIYIHKRGNIENSK